MWYSGADGMNTTSLDHVLALQGSCVLLPCSVSLLHAPPHGSIYSSPPGSPHGSSRRFPHGYGRGSRTYVDVRLKYRISLQLPGQVRIAFSTDPMDRVGAELRGRVMLSGDLSSGDCSLIISNLKTDDPTIFELELKARKASWVRVRTFHLTTKRFPPRPVLMGPAAVVLGETVVLECSVKHSCPTAPPRLRWVWERGGPDGVKEGKGTEKVEMQGETIISSLSFTPSEILKPRLRCDAIYPGNRRNSSAHIIDIHFPPMDVLVEVRTEWVKEGGSALVECVCKADPPVTQYSWSYTHLGSVVPLPHHTHSTRIHNITRNTHVQCSARNALGHKSSPLTNLNVLYPPMIGRNLSGCVWDGQVQECVCAVNSNPRSLITWSVNGSAPLTSFNITSSFTHRLQQETLRGPTHTALHTTCYVINHLGNDTLTLLQTPQTTGGDLKVYILVGLGILAAILVLFLILCFRRNRAERRRRMAARGPPVYCQTTGGYQERTPLYINCSEVTHIYTNGSYQLIYQNCTPRFIQTKQMYKRERRGARRQKRERGERDLQLPTEQQSSPADSDTAIYIEVI